MEVDSADLKQSAGSRALEGSEEPATKRIKLTNEDAPTVTEPATSKAAEDQPSINPKPVYDTSGLLPQSLSLLGITSPGLAEDGARFTREKDVGISEYIGKDVPSISGIIKQRFTDFLVFEVDLDGEVVRLKDIGMPDPAAGMPVKAKPEEVPSGPSESTLTSMEAPSITEGSTATPAELPAEPVPVDEGPWPESFTSKLSSLLPPSSVEQLKSIFLEGPEPPFVPDSGWTSRNTVAENGSGSGVPSTSVQPSETEQMEGTDTKNPKISDTSIRGRGSSGMSKRSGRGGRGGGRGDAKPKREDHRKVISDPITSKEARTQFHQVIRQLFGGKLETRAEDVKEGEEGSRIMIKWAPKGGGGDSRSTGNDRGGRGGRGRTRGGDRSGRDKQDDRPPPYIHFTLQKTNRDTQDALAHISRLLRVPVKDLSVAGTKDKRGVTVQRVALKRGPKTLQEVWQFVNTQYQGRKTLEQVMSERGERGVRIGDMVYAKSSLDLGMLKGNSFVITLRNIKADSEETIHRAMQSMKDKGFINYYGMQRFGTSSIPTHTIGLALLKSDWAKAISLLLRPRPGEYSEAEAGRRAWLERGDLKTALELIPRRAVAERCILENFEKNGGDGRNLMGALSTIPRNLRLMYVHAYQSYVWNAIVSERVRLHGASIPIVGDLVYDKDAPAAPPKKKGKYVPPNIRVLKEEDLDKYTIFDVIMPLPGRDVAYPGGELGERYKEFLRLDGLDPDNLVHTQRDYTLLGSYRHMLHLPTHLSWTILQYTDPDIALAQSDEDHHLGFSLPPTDPHGKFMALRMELQLGTAAYATMAIREVTKTETSSYHQANMTLVSEDQKFKGAVGGSTEEGGDDAEAEEMAIASELVMEETTNDVDMIDV